MNFNVCRACMKPENDTKFTSIFAENGKLSNLIFELTNLKIPNYRESPALICTACIHELKNATKLRNSILKNHQNFTDFYSQSKLRNLLCGIKVDDNFDCGHASFGYKEQNLANRRFESTNFQPKIAKTTENRQNLAKTVEINQNSAAFNIQGCLNSFTSNNLTVDTEHSRTEPEFIQTIPNETKNEYSVNSCIKSEPMDDEVNNLRQLNCIQVENIEIKPENYEIYDNSQDFESFTAESQQPDNIDKNAQNLPAFDIHSCIKNIINEKFTDTESETSHKMELIKMEPQFKPEFPLLLSAINSGSNRQPPTSFICNTCGKIDIKSCETCHPVVDINRQSYHQKIIEKYLKDPSVTVTNLSKWADVPRTTVGRIIKDYKRRNCRWNRKN